MAACDRLSFELLSPRKQSDSDSGVQGGADAHTPPQVDGGADGGPLRIDAGSQNDASIVNPAFDAGPREQPMWMSRADLPAPRGAMGVARDGKGKIHIVGGDTTYEGGTPDTAHYAYEVDDDGYDLRAPAPDAHQWGPCLLLHKGLLYSFGGWKGGGKLMRRYDPGDDTWSYLAPSPRNHIYGFACGIIDGVIYIVSGAEDSRDKVTDAVDAYDISSNTWTQRAPFPAKSKTVAGAAIGTRLYVIGRGANLDVYDSVTNEWSVGPSIGRDVKYASAFEYKGSLYVFGGVGATNVDRLDVPSLTWTALPPMSSPRIRVGVAEIVDEIHIFGGFDAQDNAVATHEALIFP